MTTPSSVARIEGVVQVVILVFMGGMAGAASFVHIHDVTVQHGQPSWIGWANAVVIELMSIVAGLDIRRRKRAGHAIGSVVAVLLAAVTISLAAQVATAEPSLWGWVVAALPALGLLAVVKIVLSRTAVIAVPDRDRTSITGQSGPADGTSDHVAARPAAGGPVLLSKDATGRAPSGVSRTAGQGGPTGHPAGRDDRPTALPSESNGARVPMRVGRTTRTAGPEPSPGPRTGPVAERTAVVDPDRLDEDVIGLGRTIAAQLAEQNRPLTRENLVEDIRAAGHTIGTDKASALLRRLKSPTESIGPPPGSRPVSDEKADQAEPATRAHSPGATPPRNAATQQQHPPHHLVSST